jgi:hypothetical protein
MNYILLLQWLVHLEGHVEEIDFSLHKPEQVEFQGLTYNGITIWQCTSSVWIQIGGVKAHIGMTPDQLKEVERRVKELRTQYLVRKLKKALLTPEPSWSQQWIAWIHTRWIQIWKRKTKEG